MINWPENTTTEQFARHRTQLEQDLEFLKSKNLPLAQAYEMTQKMIDLEINYGFEPLLTGGEDIDIRYNFIPQLTELEGESRQARRERFDEADACLTELETCLRRAKRAGVTFHPVQVLAYINTINNAG